MKIHRVEFLLLFSLIALAGLALLLTSLAGTQTVIAQSGLDDFQPPADSSAEQPASPPGPAGEAPDPACGRARMT